MRAVMQIGWTFRLRRRATAIPFERNSKRCPWSAACHTERNETVRNPFFDRVPLRSSMRNRAGEINDARFTRMYACVRTYGGGDARGEKLVFERSRRKCWAIYIYCTDLHYPRFAPFCVLSPFPRSTDTHPVAHRQPTNCPVTHEPVVHVIAVTHKITFKCLLLLARISFSSVLRLTFILKSLCRWEKERKTDREKERERGGEGGKDVRNAD